jgi:hypothetical protein
MDTTSPPGAISPREGSAAILGTAAFFRRRITNGT